MAARSQDTGTDTAAPAAHVRRLVEALRTGPARAHLLEAFGRAVLRRASPRQVMSLDSTWAVQALAGSLAFVDGRPETIAVRMRDVEVSLDGWHPVGTVCEVCCDDRPLLVTTVTEALLHLGHPVVRSLSPIFGAERDPSGHLAAITPARSATRRETLLQVELADHVPPSKRAPIEAAVRRVVEDVFAVTDDEAAMRDVVARTARSWRQRAPREIAPEDVEEAAAFLDWLLDDNFVLTGACRFGPVPSDVSGPPAGPPLVPGSCLGILTRVQASPAAPWPLPADPVTISRSAELSTVHRRVPLHQVGIVEYGADGSPAGLTRVVGVFAYKANAEPAAVTPLLRSKLRRILEIEDVVPGSHDEATIESLFQVLPKDDLFQEDVESLRATIVELLASERESDVRVLLRVGASDRTVTALVSVPRDRYGPALRRRVEQFLLAQLDGAQVDVEVSLGDRAETVARFLVHLAGPAPTEPLDSLAREVRLLCRTWAQNLAAALAEHLDEATAMRLADIYAQRFPADYREVTTPEEAAEEVLEIEALTRSGVNVRIVLAQDRDHPGGTRLKVFTAGARVELSDFLPVLESLGLWVLDELAHTLVGTAPELRVHDFGVRAPAAAPLDIEADGARLADAAVAMLRGDAEVDLLNRLVLRASLPWPDVAVLRAYRRYRRQLGTAYSTSYVGDVLVEHAPTARLLVEYFAARFDPGWVSRPAAVPAAELRARVVAACDAAESLDHDRILRSFLYLVDATLRTNRYLPPADRGSSSVAPATGTTLSFKFDCRALPDVPKPVPYREIFVHSPRMEGSHVRWGPVARGGVRWSDRLDDYRSEVLALMHAQVLKNAVIVPTGAKGAFVLRRRSADVPLADDVANAYAEFIRGLLDLTDNVVGGEVVGVPCRADGDDPYLVVAADRGTATFSDLANAIAAERGFWLGDAFASGGSHGYDHKALGITARGTWVAVQRHFHELGVDVQTEAITVIGIGDMSGDVFGNGMLQSEAIALVAAFDHRDIFLDPAPDPARAFDERRRLFALRRSSWQEYDRAAISPGGGVWPRSAKSVPLSPEVRDLLRVDAEALRPNELIRALLGAPVDLLFAGGVGTFVRATSEREAEIDDRANADVRVEAASVRARVVAEGANLAVTQRARVEYARRGGRVNADAIDNACGVDISDHEVNLEMLLYLGVQAGAIGDTERRSLLVAATQPVVEAVLSAQRLQTTALSRELEASPGQLPALEALVEQLTQRGVLDPVVEALPGPEEMAARGRAGAGLTRPELAVLVAGAKRDLAATILASTLPDEEALHEALRSYFPPLLAQRFDSLLVKHRLRRELVACVVANDVVNRMGATFVNRVAHETGAEPAAVVAAYWVARVTADAESYWADVDFPGDDVPWEEQLGLCSAVSGLLEAMTRDYVRQDAAAGFSGVVDRDRAAFAHLEAAVSSIGSPARRRQRQRRAEALVDSGVAPAVALKFACLDDLEPAADTAELARATGRPVVGVAEAFFELSERLGIDRLAASLATARPPDRWGRAARRALIDDLDDLRRQVVRSALDLAPEAAELDAATYFLEARLERFKRVHALLRDVESDSPPRLDAMTVAARAVRQAIN